MTTSTKGTIITGAQQHKPALLTHLRDQIRIPPAEILETNEHCINSEMSSRYKKSQQMRRKVQCFWKHQLRFCQSLPITISHVKAIWASMGNMETTTEKWALCGYNRFQDILTRSAGISADSKRAHHFNSHKAVWQQVAGSAGFGVWI